MSDATCSVPGCVKKAGTRGFCNPHYQRWYRYGDPEAGGGYQYRPPAERFREKYAVNASGCWIWQLSRDKDGYGKFTAEGKDFRAHIYAWVMVNGPVPPGMVLDHIVCDTPPCCNPAHLRVTTIWGNSERTQSIAAVNARKTHCKHGHVFDEANTLKVPGGRGCRTCKRAWDRAHPRKRVRN